MMQVSLWRSPLLACRQLSAMCAVLRMSNLPLLLIWRRDGYVQLFRTPATRPQKNKTVTFSSILSQNGVEFQELPILIRLMDKSMLPFVTHSYQGESAHSAVEDTNFQHLLAECTSLKHIYDLLNIPSGQLHGNAASATLVRLTELQRSSGNWDQLESFVYKAIVNGLCDAVARDVSKLTNYCLLSLVPCYLLLNDFGENCTLAVREEVKKRITEARFETQELCKLSVMCSNIAGDQGLVDCVWAYIGQQVSDIYEDNIAIVLSSLPPTHKFLLPLLGKQFHKTWWKLNSTEIVLCLANLVKLNSLQVNVFKDVGSWLFLNIHEVKEQELSLYVSAFLHFDFYDANLLSALERYVSAKGKQLSTELLALVVEYCRSRRYYSPTIFDAAAAHFGIHCDTYQPLELFTVLRAFGQLNYLPRDEQAKFLVQAEKMIDKNFSDFDIGQICELLCSFAFIAKIPLNIVPKVFSYSFLSRFNASPQSQEAGIWLEMLQSAVKLDAKGFHIPCLFKIMTRQKWRDTRLYILQKQLKKCFEELLGSGTVKMQPFAGSSLYLLDAEVIVSSEGIPKPVSYQDKQCRSPEDKRLAVLIITPSTFCVNTHHLLGEFAMRQRHLRKMGYTVIEVYDKEFMPLNQREQTRYLKRKLEPVIDFMKLTL